MCRSYLIQYLLVLLQPKIQVYSILTDLVCFFLFVFCVCSRSGMEVAAALTDKAHSVSVIGIESVPFKKALGEKVGKAIMKV